MLFQRRENKYRDLPSSFTVRFYLPLININLTQNILKTISLSAAEVFPVPYGRRGIGRYRLRLGNLWNC